MPLKADNRQQQRQNTNLNIMSEESNGNKIKQEKLKALQLTLDKIEKGYGKGTIMKMGDSAIENIASIPSGSISLDVALGVGGYPQRKGD